MASPFSCHSSRPMAPANARTRGPDNGRFLEFFKSIFSAMAGVIFTIFDSIAIFSSDHTGEITGECSHPNRY